MDYTFDYNILDPELRVKSAVEHDYKTLINLCKTSKGVFKSICGSNYFWEKKTKYDFGDLYDNIEKIGRNWWDTYQHYRSVFSKEFISSLKSTPTDAESILDAIDVINERGFLIVDETDGDVTALIAAAEEGYGDIVQFLLEEEEADPNLADEYGWTALMVASYYGHTDIVEMLLRNRANPNFKNMRGFKALQHAFMNGHDDIVDILEPVTESS